MDIYLNKLKNSSNKALGHVVDLFEVVVNHWWEITARGARLLYIRLHSIDVIWAVADVVSDGSELLHLLSQDAVEGHAGLKKADVARAKAELPTNLTSQLGKGLVVRTESEFVLSHEKLRSLLSICTSEHICYSLLILYNLVIKKHNENS